MSDNPERPDLDVPGRGKMADGRGNNSRQRLDALYDFLKEDCSLRRHSFHVPGKVLPVR